jgi:hypothetical protein
LQDDYSLAHSLFTSCAVQDQAARCRRLARSIADDAAKPELTGGGIRADAGLAEERQENWGAVKRGERGSRSGPLATTVVCFRGCM